jgi:ABC-2 type transport system permease protein
MTAQLRSEALKLRTTGAVALLVLFAAAVTLLGALSEALAPTVAKLAQEDTQRTVFSAAGSTAVLFATFAGLIAVTAEFRYGTIRPTLLVEPRRGVVLAAKLVASALAGLLVAAACVAVSFGAGLLVFAVRDVDVVVTGDHVIELVFGTAAASALGAMLGVAVGALIRNQAGAIVAVMAYAVAVDAVLFATVPSVGRYLPGKAADALVGRPVEHLLSPGLGAAVLAAWTLAFVVAAILRTERTDT